MQYVTPADVLKHEGHLDASVILNAENSKEFTVDVHPAQDSG